MKALRLLTLLALTCRPFLAAAEPLTINVWPGKPPGETKDLPPEADQTTPEDKLIAGRRIIKLGNVSTPQLEVHRPPQRPGPAAAQQVERRRHCRAVHV